MRFRPTAALRVALVGLLLVLAGAAGGGGDEVAEPTTTTVVNLFDDTSTTTTIGKLVVPGWTPTSLPDLVAAADECVNLAEIGADPLPEEGPRTVTVESGDSLGKIAKRYDRTVEQFMRANGITDPNRLQVGQVLVVPRKRTEEVETVDGLAIVVEPVYCAIDTGVAAFGPDGQQVGGPGIIEVYADWKRVEGPRAAPRVNGRLRGLIVASVEAFLDEVVPLVERHGYSCRDATNNRCTWLQHRPEVLLATDNYFSVRDTVRRLLPGAVAAESEVLAETFDLSTGLPVLLDELFDPETDWVPALSAAAIERLANQPWTDERRVVGAGPDAANFERFNLTHGGLVLSFTPGTIGGSGSHTVSITIPYRALEGFWLPDGPVPLLG